MVVVAAMNATTIECGDDWVEEDATLKGRGWERTECRKREREGEGWEHLRVYWVSS